MADLFTGGTKEEAMLGALMKLCKPCCPASGYVPIEYTDCRCAYPYTFNPEDPQPPPQPAGGFFPTILYYKADLSGNCEDCYETTVSTEPCVPTITLVTATVQPYCSGPVTVPLYYCGPITNTYDGELALCDYTFTMSNGATFTIRKYIRINIVLTCTECVTIDATWLVDRGLDPEVYADWIGLEYCPPSSAEINRNITYKTISQSLGVGGINVQLDPGGALLFPCDTTPCTGVAVCSAGYGRITINYGGLPVCSNVNLLQSEQGIFTQYVFCCTTNNFDVAPVGGCGCMPSNEKLYIPGAC